MCNNNGTIIVLRKNVHAVYTQTNAKGYMGAGINDQKITYSGNDALAQRIVKTLRADLDKELEFVEGFLGYSIIHIRGEHMSITHSCMDKELVEATNIIASHEFDSSDD